MKFLAVHLDLAASPRRSRWVLLVLVAATIAFAAATACGGGGLTSNQRASTAGVVVGGSGSVDAIAVQRDGKVVVANSDAGSVFGLVRYTAGGGLDGSFGKSGVVLTAVGTESHNFDMVIQADGRIVSAGYGGPTTFALTRHLVDGRLDQSFGRGGKVVTSFGPISSIADANALAIQADGKIVAAGDYSVDVPESFALARYMPNGKLDATFGSGGKVLTGFRSGSNGAKDVAIDGEGRIVAAGSTALVRYLPDGGLDPGFGTAGKVLTGFGPKRNVTLGAIAIQPDGKIIAVGESGDYGSGGRFVLIRYTPAGHLDPSFGRRGEVVTALGPKTSAGAQAVVLQPDGKIVAAGTLALLDQTRKNFRGDAVTLSDIALVRYLPDGRLDPTFGKAGTVITNVGPFDSASAIALQPNGNIVVGCGESGKIALAGYLPNGRLDPSFGGG